MVILIPNEMIKLSDLEPGQSAKIIRINSCGRFKLKLLELGIAPEVIIYRLDNNFHKLYRVRGFTFSFGNSNEDVMIDVEKIET